MNYNTIRGKERKKVSTNIMNNLGYIAEIKGTTLSSISREVGKGYKYLTTLKKSFSIPDEEVVNKLCEKFKLTEDVLFYTDMKAEYENLVKNDVIEPVKKIVHKTPEMKIPRLEKKVEKKVLTTEAHVVHDDIDTNVEIITLLMNMSKKYKLKIDANHENGNIVIDCGKQIADFFYINSGINRA